MKSVLQWIEQEGIVTLSPRKSGSSLVTKIAGQNVSGNWWGHPKANQVYNTFLRLREEPDILVCKLVDRKVTLIHRSVWLHIYLIVTNPNWRYLKLSSISEKAKILLGEITKAGSMRLDILVHSSFGTYPDLKQLQKELELAGLVISTDEHTETGTHQTVLRTWEDFFRERGFSSKMVSTVSDEIAQLKEIAAGGKLSVDIPQSTRTSSKKINRR